MSILGERVVDVAHALSRRAHPDLEQQVSTVQPFLGSEFDAQPGSTSERRQTYVVCSTPRSGSTFFCQSLISTGVAGVPIEYFNPAWRAILSRRWGCGPGLVAYAEALQARRVGPTGVFGTKLHWHELEAIRTEAYGRRRPAGSSDQPGGLLEDLLGARPTFVRIRRNDLNRQAVSLWSAEYTGVWSRAHGVAEPPSVRVPYSFAGIERCRFRIALAEVQWDRYLRAAATDPVELLYEDLLESYAATIAGVLDRLVPGAADGGAVPASVVAPLTSPQSEHLLDRFLHDVGRRRSPTAYRPLRSRVRALLGRRFGRA